MYLHLHTSSKVDTRSSTEQTCLAVGSRNWCQWSRSGHWEWGCLEPAVWSRIRCCAKTSWDGSSQVKFWTLTRFLRGCDGKFEIIFWWLDLKCQKFETINSSSFNKKHKTYKFEFCEPETLFHKISSKKQFRTFYFLLCFFRTLSPYSFQGLKYLSYITYC